MSVDTLLTFTSLPIDVQLYFTSHFLQFNDICTMLDVSRTTHDVASSCLRARYNYDVSNRSTMSDFDKSLYQIVTALALFDRDPQGRVTPLIRLISRQEPYINDYHYSKYYANRIFTTLNARIYYGMLDGDHLRPVFSILLSNLLWTKSATKLKYLHIRLWMEFVPFFDRVCSLLLNESSSEHGLEAVLDEVDVTGTTSYKIGLYIWHLASMGFFNKMTSLIADGGNDLCLDLEDCALVYEAFNTAAVHLRVVALFLRKEHIQLESPYYCILQFEDFAKRIKLAAVADSIASEIEKTCMELNSPDYVCQISKLFLANISRNSISIKDDRCQHGSDCITN